MSLGLVEPLRPVWSHFSTNVKNYDYLVLQSLLLLVPEVTTISFIVFLLSVSSEQVLLLCFQILNSFFCSISCDINFPFRNNIFITQCLMWVYFISLILIYMSFHIFFSEINHILNSFYSCPLVLSFLPLFLLINFSVYYGYFPIEGKVGEKHQILFLEMLNVWCL